ncbi:hypothetical protein PSACC_01903 [Paramicrosporidium saccamoebae]|uniref:Uncharacterized protein n=1 Tax=Paramicrosporidium saccamoebae TaxID=1246581 RepID=A0A2H9TKI9_9FUNG|nr:hypothetical protein PSACC_01903 [Paramicrosporidium saccamoebae]
MSQADIDNVIVYGHGHMLRWYLDTNRLALLPSPATLSRVLLRHPSYKTLDCYASVRRDWTLSQNYIDDATRNGQLRALEWYDRLMPNRIQPSSGALNLAYRAGHKAIITWYLKKDCSKGVILLLTLIQSLEI